MKKVLFISDMNIKDKTGATANGLMHLHLLKELCQGNLRQLGISTSDDEQCDESVTYIRTSTVLEKIISILQGYPAYLNKRMRKAAFETIKNCNTEIVFIDNSISGKFVKEIKQSFPNTNVICFFHDIEHCLMKDQIKNASVMRKCNLITMIRNEQFTTTYSDKCIVLNKRDAQLFQTIYNRTPDFLLPIVLERPSFQNCSRVHYPNQKLKLLFVGANYYPNVNGIRWFVETVMKKLQDECELTIVGNKMEQYKNEFECTNVFVKGTVENLEPFYETAHMIVLPIFEGGGMKVKTGEALISGKSVVGTTEALTGYWDDLPSIYKGTSVYECNTNTEFIHCIENLYKRKFNVFNCELAKWAYEMYSFETNLKRMSDIIS